MKSSAHGQDRPGLRHPPGAGGLSFAGPAISLCVLTVVCRYALSPSPEAKHLSDFGSHPLYLTFIVLAAILLLWKGLRGRIRQVLWWPVTVGLCTFLCVEALKKATLLTRPDGEPTGFPSGHTTFAFALAWLLSRTHPRLAPLWFGMAVSVGWARVEGNAHFPYQVLVGAVLGTAIGWWVSQCSGRLFGRPVAGGAGPSERKASER